MNEDARKCTKHKLVSSLNRWFIGFKRAVIVGIGNPLRRDDFVGTRIVRDLRDKVSKAVSLIECETVPESFIEPITKFNPSHILIIDAALLNLEPGTARLVSYKDLKDQQAVSTHALPLRIFCQCLQQLTEARIALLLIQPEDTGFGESLTQELENTMRQLVKLLSGILDE